MKRQLLIIGAGSVGAYIAWNIDRLSSRFKVLGFLDDRANASLPIHGGKPVIGPIEAISEYRDVSVMLAIAAPSDRRRVLEAIADHALDFPTLVAPYAWISEGVRMGRGSIVYPGVSINYETRLGDFSIINMNCAIGHNCKLGAFTTLAPGVNLGGFTTVGSEVDVGIGASTRQHVSIGKGATVGGQSMVISDVAPGETVAGIPARSIASK